MRGASPHRAWALPRGIAALPLTIALACSSGEAPVVAPETLYFAPHRTTRALAIHNPSAEAIKLSKIRLDTGTPDWGSFLLTDETLPKQIPAGGSVELQLSADRQHFVGERPHNAPARYRRGRARLLFNAAGKRSVELRFEPAKGDSLGIALAKLGIFTALVAGLLALARRSSELLKTIPWLFLLVLAILPWGPALCFGGLRETLSASALGQCAEGYEGTALTLSAPDGGLLIALGLLLLGDLARTGAAYRQAAPASEIRRHGRRIACDLAAVLALAPAIVAGASLDPAALIEHQVRAGWGVFVHPVAALLTATLLLQRPTSARRHELEEFALAALYNLVFLGGWAFPGQEAALHALPHGLFVPLAVASGVAKTAALVVLLRVLRRRTAELRQAAPALHLGLLGLAALNLLAEACIATFSAVV